jgi:hypothetical protein
LRHCLGLVGSYSHSSEKICLLLLWHLLWCFNLWSHIHSTEKICRLLLLRSWLLRLIIHETKRILGLWRSTKSNIGRLLLLRHLLNWRLICLIYKAKGRCWLLSWLSYLIHLHASEKILLLLLLLWHLLLPSLIHEVKGIWSLLLLGLG